MPIYVFHTHWWLHRQIIRTFARASTESTTDSPTATRRKETNETIEFFCARASCSPLEIS